MAKDTKPTSPHPLNKRNPRKPKTAAAARIASKKAKSAKLRLAVAAGSPLAQADSQDLSTRPEAAKKASVSTAPEIVAQETSPDQETTSEPDKTEPEPKVAAVAEATPLPTAKSVTTPEISHQAKPITPVQSRRRIRGSRLFVAGIVLLALAIGLRIFVHAGSDTGASAKENKSLITEVGAKALLPTGETPSITTVVDKDKVSQAFLANSVNGDKVLLYFQAGKAFVYRPSTHQIVNIGSLRQPPAKIFLRNGTTAAKIPASISDNLNNPSVYSIVSSDSSAKHTYTKTMVIDVAGNRPDVANRVAKTIGGQVSSLPAGESSPDADILIIVGSDTK